MRGEDHIVSKVTLDSGVRHETGTAVWPSVVRSPSPPRGWHPGAPGEKFPGMRSVLAWGLAALIGGGCGDGARGVDPDLHLKVSVDTARGLGAGRYLAPSFPFSAAGSWVLTARVELPDGRWAEVRHRVEVADGG